MKMSLAVEGLRADVVSVGELGDDTVAEVAERIAGVLDRSVPTRILDLLSDVAAELTAELPEGRIEIRLAGDDVDLAYVEDEPTPARAPESASADLSARITLRLSDGLKVRIEEGAAHEGTSVNAYVLRMLERGVSAGRGWNGRGGSRLRGYGAT